MTQTTHPTIPHPTVNGARIFGVTNNVTRITFKYIQDHPHCKSGDVVADLIPKGFKKGSVTPIITHLVKAKQVHRDPQTRTLCTVVPEYVPIPAKIMKLRIPTELRNVKNIPKPVVKEKRKYTKRAQAAGIAALAVAPQPAPQEEAPRQPSTLLLNRNWTAQGVVDKLSVVQARQLYDLLKQIFGG